MKQVLVTGATGAVGAPIVSQLVNSGARVRCLVRNPQDAHRLFPGSVDLVEGDIEDSFAVERAMMGCDVAFHAAGIPEQWTPNPDVFRRVNLEGTRNALSAAHTAGVKSFLYVSTHDTFDLDAPIYDENLPSRDLHPSAYEASKLAAQVLVDLAAAQGMPVRSIHPCAVYGPGAARPTGLTQLIHGLRHGKVPQLLAGGTPVVFNGDVAGGAILAAERAQPGAKFILSESYQSLEQIAKAIKDLYPETTIPGILPVWLAMTLAIVGMPISAITRRPPLVTRDIVGVMTRKGRPNSARARLELGWNPIGFREGLAATLGSAD